MAFWVSGVDSPQEIYTRTGDGRDLVVMSGTAYFNFKGTGPAWRRDDAYVIIGPFWHRLDDVAPMAALGSWSNDHTAVCVARMDRVHGLGSGRDPMPACTGTGRAA
jgi:hypothetical protein